MAADCTSPNKHKSPPSSSSIPWAQVVRGADSEATKASTPLSPSNQSENNTDNVLVNKAFSDNNENKSAMATSPVIGGEVSWPALSECTRSNSPKTIAPPQGPIIQRSSEKHSQSYQKQDNNNNNSHSNSNSKHSMSGRQRSMKHHRSGGGGGSMGGPAQGGFSRPPPPPPSPPPFPIFEMPYGNLMPAVMDPSIVGPRPAGGVMHLPHIGANHSSPRRRESSGARPHGDWNYNQGNRHNHDRRDGHLPYQFVPRHGGFIPPPPPGSPPFMPPPVRSLGCPIGFDVGSPFMYVPTLQGMPPPPPPMLYPIDPNLPNLLLKQIDYYFSDANLVQDRFLRSKMDAEGWVPIDVIAKFPRVKQLTNDILFILDCLKASKLVEVQGERIRRRDDWKKWIHTNSSTTEFEPHTTTALETTFNNVSLDKSATNIQTL